jgi:hypothetical protein
MTARALPRLHLAPNTQGHAGSAVATPGNRAAGPAP